MSAELPPSPARVPMLTEVVRDAPVALGPAPPGAAIDDPAGSDAVPPPCGLGPLQPPPEPIAGATPDVALRATAAADASRVVERVLADLRHRIDPMLEYRLRDALAPALARVADLLVEQARVELAETLREIVAEAVTQEVVRQRGD